MPSPEEKILDNPPPPENTRYRQSIAWGYYLARLPWWAIAMVALLIYAVFWIFSSESRTKIFWEMLDNPALTTEDKYRVVYAVGRDVVVIDDSLLVRLSSGQQVSVSPDAVLSESEGAFTCADDAPASCLPGYGRLVTFRQPATVSQEPDGIVQREERGILRSSLGTLATIDMPDGTSHVVSTGQIISREESVLPCNQIVNPACENLEGTIVTFMLEIPYIEQTGLVVREDILIRHEDAYQETVRPIRLSQMQVETCEGESPFCHLGEVQTAVFRENVIGVEVENTDDRIRIRTVDEQTVFIARDRILEMRSGLVECDQVANPRCEDFQGTIIEARGEIIKGELTVDTGRVFKIIPEGAELSVEVARSEIISDVRTPEDCTYADLEPCYIVVQLEDETYQGSIVADTNDGLLIQTVAPVFIDIDPDHILDESRAPHNCALNNPQGCNRGIWLTLLVTITAYGLALMIGLLFGLMRVSSNIFLHHFATFYVELIRGLPLLVLLLFFAYVIGPIIRDYSGPGSFLTSGFYSVLNSIELWVLGEESFLGEAVLGLAIGYGAFLAEVFRAGIQSIGRGQMEAARSLGMSYFQAMRHVILPQAIRTVLPPLGNDFIAMLKDSALISVLALPDLLQNGRLYISRTFQPIPVYVVVAILYIMLTLILSYIVRNMEKRMKLP